MADDKPYSLAQRVFHACLLVFGAVVALWLAVELLAQFWGWLLLLATTVLGLWLAVALYRYWSRRRF